MKTAISPEHAWIILNGLPNIGPIALRRLLPCFNDDPSKILEANRSQLKKVEGIGDTLASIIVNWQGHFDLDKELDRLAQYKARFIHCLSDDYPPLLKEIYDPPTGLYFLGDYVPRLKTIAIVGSRRCTLYGQKVAKQLASELARMGFCVVSGMARGIDSAAHEGALEAGGKTIAVLGCGPDIVYPPENRDLYLRIRETGAVVSEFNFGKQADKTTFPRRNRIVSGMSQAIIVVETNSNGGSMITARLAGEQGRHVFAVPGRIDQVSSKGCHELIRDGASLCMSVDNILEELNYLTQLDLPFGEGSNKANVVPPELEGLEKEVFVELQGRVTATSDTLATHLKRPVQEITSTLLMLELKKHVAKRVDGTFELNA